MAHTKKSIEDLFENPKTQKRAVEKAIFYLYKMQTTDEQDKLETRHHNGVGFNSADGFMGTSMGKFYSRRGYLTPKQISYWTRREKSGKMRIQKYSSQLLAEAKRKELHD